MASISTTILPTDISIGVGSGSALIRSLKRQLGLTNLGYDITNNVLSILNNGIVIKTATLTDAQYLRLMQIDNVVENPLGTTLIPSITLN